MNISLVEKLVYSKEFQALAPGAIVCANDDDGLFVRIEYNAVEDEGIYLASEYHDGWAVYCQALDRQLEPGEFKRLTAPIREAHHLLVGLSYIDEPVSGYSPEINQKFNRYRDAAIRIVDGPEGFDR